MNCKILVVTVGLALAEAISPGHQHAPDEAPTPTSAPYGLTAAKPIATITSLASETYVSRS
jgi:hypothetical protein